MSGASLQSYPIVLPNPDVNGQNPNNVLEINSIYSEAYTILFDAIRTLSTTGAGPADQIAGLFYVPDLDSTSTCINASAPYVPANVARYGELPSGVQGILAVAPWLSPDCTQEYLAAARNDSPQGFVFFLPNSGTAQPPPANDNVWGLGDNGAWKSQNNFPVYAIPGAGGTLVMSSLAAYSGNMTEVPYGHALTEIFDPRDFVRILGVIDIAGGANSLPSLWVFLLIVLGILLAVIAITSLLMHLIQRRRRQNLRRRVADGEVDLELLGIKRLTVPQALLDEMPLYTYGTGSPAKSRTNQETPTVTKSVSVATQSCPTIKENFYSTSSSSSPARIELSPITSAAANVRHLPR